MNNFNMDPLVNYSPNSDKIVISDQESTAENNAEGNKIVEEDEDVPGDFFDDFLKEDFMAGLDIIDEDNWDDDNAKNDKRKHEADSSEQKRCREKDSRSLEQKPKKDKINVDDFDIRRDPLKTKRDIERDKAKCEKDKEKKVISEKLRFVETGLVPPGTEMEIDVEELKKQNVDKTISERKGKSRDNISKKRSHSRKSVSREKKKRSPGRRSSPKRSPLRKKSPLRRTSPRNLRRTFRARRRSRSSSPYRRPVRFSPASLRRRSHSRSPVRKRDGKSFLEEIVEKLNEPSKYRMPQPPPMVPHMPPFHFMTPQNPIMPTPPILPVPPPIGGPLPIRNPTPVPAPSSISINFPHTQTQSQYDLYDQNFFIGNSTQSANISPVNTQLKTIPVNSPLNIQDTNRSSVENMSTISKNSSDEFTKLFQDKKISLSEFLALSAKPEVSSSSPLHLQEKIRVIARCQDAIKFLECAEKKFSGRLVVHKIDRPPAEKFQSPLVKMRSQMRIPFTDIPIRPQNKSYFNNCLNKLLQTLGLANEAAVTVEVPARNNWNFSGASPHPPPPPQISNKSVNDIFYNPVSRVASKFSQTEVYRCCDCEIRKKKIYKSTAVQCNDDRITYSVSTQIPESDVHSNLKTWKNQSLASLTPAQLLATTSIFKSSNKDDFDILPAKSNVYNPVNEKLHFVPPGEAAGGSSLGPGGGRGRGIGNQPRNLMDIEFNRYDKYGTFY